MNIQVEETCDDVAVIRVTVKHQNATTIFAEGSYFFITIQYVIFFRAWHLSRHHFLIYTYTVPYCTWSWQAVTNQT